MASRSRLEKTLFCCVCVLCVVLVIVFGVALRSQEENNICNEPECVQASMHILTTVDATFDPCDDFYKFTCGTFLKNAFRLNQPSIRHPLADLTKNQLKEILLEPEESKDIPKSLSYQRKFIRACMNTTAIDEDQNRRLLEILDEVLGGWPASKNDQWIEGSDFSWTNVMLKAREHGVFHQFLLSVQLFSDSISSKPILWIKPPHVEAWHWKNENLEYMAEVAKVLGKPSIKINSELRTTMDFVEELQKISVNVIENDDYVNDSDENLVHNIKDLKHKFIKVDWLNFLRNLTQIDLQGNERVRFEAEKYFDELYYVLLRTPRRIQANYMAWTIITRYSECLSENIRKIFEKNLQNSPHNRKEYTKRADLCIDLSKELFNNVAEGEYVRRYASLEKRSYIKEMISYIKKEFESSIKKTTWLNGEDKNKSLEIVKGVKEEVGWTSIVFDVKKFEEFFGFDKLIIKTNIIDMIGSMIKAKTDKYFTRLNDNTTEWDIELSSPLLDINAYYIRSCNMLILPAPILQSPIFDLKRPHYMNFGALGTIIGHEYTHAFSQDPELEQIWSNETTQAFLNEAECINEEYEIYQNTTHLIKNESSFEENIADFNGLTLAVRAYQRWVHNHGQDDNLPGVRQNPNQIFWIMASTYSCYEPKLIDDNDKVFKKDSNHGLPSFRVVGRLRNSHEFAEDFNCAEGSWMNPKEKCQVFG